MSDLPLSIPSYTLPTITVSLEAEGKKAAALALAADVKEVSDELTQEAAVMAMRSLKDLSKTVEDARVEAKKPSLEFGKSIDTVAKTFVSMLETEYQRLQRLVGSFQAIERQKVIAQQEAARKVLEDQNRAEAERRRKEQEAAQQGVAAAPMAPAPRPAPAPLPTAPPPKPKGLAVGEDWEITVLDLVELYRAHPQFVELTLKKSIVKDALRSGLITACPGLRIEKVTKARV